MDYVKINGKSYDVIVTEISESFTIMYSDNTVQTIGTGARMSLDPLGTAYGHTVTFKRSKDNFADFDNLFEEVSKPKIDGVPVEIVHGQTTISYQAYISTGERELKRIDRNTGKVYWNELSLEITPMEAQVIPV